MIPYWSNLWQDLPDEIREQLMRQSRSGPPPVPYAVHPESCSCARCAWARANFYAAHPGDCPCAICGWARDQNALVPDSERAVCGHERGCRCPECLAQRVRIAAGKLEAAKLTEEERDRRKAAANAVREQIQAGTITAEIPGQDPSRCGCKRCARLGGRCPAGCSSCARIEAAQKTAAITGTGTIEVIDITTPEDRVQALVPAEAPEEPPPDPAGEIEAALREFDAWYAAGRGTLPDPEPLPAGICRACHLSPAVTNGQCFWCDLADTLRAQDLERARTREAAAGSGGSSVSTVCRRISAGILILMACWIVAGMILWMFRGVMA